MLKCFGDKKPNKLKKSGFTKSMHNMREKALNSVFEKVPQTHIQSLTNVTYGQGKHPKRTELTQQDVPWTRPLPSYDPVDYTANVVHNNTVEKVGPVLGWADPEWSESFAKTFWSERKTFCGPDLSKFKGEDGRPRNPVGRTGMKGRGLLGKWGPNHAADPIVTCCSPVTGKLCMVVVKRQDNGKWAIPGGMVDKDELATKTLKREFGEEAASDGSGDMEKVLNEIFKIDRAVEIYKGYVDDPRNTDNAWMETTVVHCHCAPHLAERLKLTAGDDAVGAAWLCIEDNPKVQELYASHGDFVKRAVEMFNAKKKESEILARTTKMSKNGKSVKLRD